MPTRGRQGPAGQVRGERFACGARLWPPGRVWRAIWGGRFLGSDANRVERSRRALFGGVLASFFFAREAFFVLANVN